MTSNNQSAFQRAIQLMPGGVNSPVRAFKAVGGNPAFIRRAQGAYLYDADDREYLDYVGSWGPAILGHGAPAVIQAVTDAAGRGLSFGAPTELEVEFATAITTRYPAIEMMRCVSSGTEATMSALRAARGATGRDVIVKFEGGYHGHSDCLLVKAGSGAATFGSPDSAGVPASVVQDTWLLRYNDLDALTQLMGEHGKKVAAVIVEPVAGNMGCVPPREGFLQAVVDLCEHNGAVAIFDEVMTGSRVSPGGAQALYGVKPHMTCLGKIVGGGLPLAVYGGKADIMNHIAPMGEVYQAGTLSGNPLAVSAGLATLSALDTALYEHLEQLGASLERGITKAIETTQSVASVQRVGSMITLFFHPGPVNSWDDASQCDTARFGRFHQAMMAQGIYWPPAQFEAAFISKTHRAEDIELTVTAIANALQQSI